MIHCVNVCLTKPSTVFCLSKTSQVIFDLHPGFSHMEDEKGNKLHLFKEYFKMMFLLYKPSLVLIVIHFNRFLCDENFCKEKLKSKICGFLKFYDPCRPS